MPPKPVIRTCHKCHTKFVIGVAGVYDDLDRPTCDTCAGVVRDEEGNAFLPNETSARYINNLTGQITTRQRPTR